MPKPKQKKSKAQLEAEKKAIEEEEERILLIKEEEERRRKEEARHLKELARKNKINRWTRDWNTFTNQKSERHNRKVYEQKIINDQSSWEAYLKCEDIIDIRDVRAIRTFLSEAQSDPCIFEQCHFSNLCHQINQIVRDLQVAALLSNDKICESDYDGIRIRDLQKLMKELLEEATASFLLDWEVKNETKERLFLGKGSDVAFSFGSSVSLPNVTIERDGSNECCLRLVRIPFLDVENFGAQQEAIGDIYQFDALPGKSSRSGEPQESKYEFKMKIPTHMLLSNCKLMLFNDGSWKEDGVSNFVIVEDNGDQMASCDLNQRSAILGLVQPRVLDLPYRSWKLGPIIDQRRKGEKVVRFSLQTSRHSLTFQCFQSTCCLVQPDIPEFRSILGVEFLPTTLLLKLSNMGVHLLPINDNILEKIEFGKARIIEESFYDELSLLSTSFEIESSLHNKAIGRERALCQVKESTFVTASDNPLPMHLLLSEVERKSLVAQNQEESESLPPDCELVIWSLLEDYEEENFDLLSFQKMGERDIDECSHLHPLFCMGKFSSKQAYDRVIDSSPTTTDTVKQLLRLVRPLIYCE